MIARSVIFGVVTVLLFFFAIINYGATGEMTFWVLPAIAGLLLTIGAVVNNRRIQFSNNRMIITGRFGGQREFILDQVVSWTQHQFNLRGLTRGTLILFFNDGQKIVVSTFEDRDVFEKIHSYLSTHKASLGTYSSFYK